MIRTFLYSDKGPRIQNQDFYCLEIVGDHLFSAVADGVGGNNGGEEASRFAINTMLAETRKDSSLATSMDSAHLGLIAAAEKSPDLYGMATTLTAVRCKGNVLEGVHCGDSRAYILRGEGIKQLTTDHTEVARLLNEGQITKEEAMNYPRKNILTSALGVPKRLAKQTFEFEILPGDRLLLLTDGVHSLVSKHEIQKTSIATPDLSHFCESLIARVREQGATDNFTLIGIEFGTLAVDI